MDTAILGSPRNRLLQALPDADRIQLAPLLTRVDLKMRKRLQTARRPIEYVYFPDSGIASVIAVGGAERSQAEVGLIGREGLSGFAAALGAMSCPYEVMVQLDGTAHAMAVDDFRKAMKEIPAFRDVCLRYVHAFTVQAAHTALANAHGRIDERLSRWLLMVQDRTESSEIVITHEFLSLMLGVRRASVTVTLQQLEDAALVETARGRVTILEREKLKERAKGLYGTPEIEYERLF